jgi:Rod binding domain-containing protein
MAQRGGLGLADLIVKGLTRRQDAQDAASTAKP